jgi:hypothetical protein
MVRIQPSAIFVTRGAFVHVYMPVQIPQKPVILEMGSGAGELVTSPELIAAVAERMGKRPRDGAYQTRSCEMIVAMTFGAAAHRETAAPMAPRGDAAEAVVRAMRAHPANRSLQRFACLALFRLCEGAQQSVVTRSRSAGAVEAVVAAAGAFSQSRALQQYACAALTAVIREDTTEDNRARAVIAGAVRRVVAAMRAFPRSASVQGNACAALQAMGAPANADVVDVTVAAVRTYPRKSHIIFSALDALLFNVTDAPVLVNGGVVETIVQVMRDNPKDNEVQTRACLALYDMCSKYPELVQIRAGGAGAVLAVVTAMRAATWIRLLQQLGCLALIQITGFNVENQNRAGHAKAIETVVAAMRAHRTDRCLNDYACEALLVMSDGNTNNCDRAVSAGALFAADFAQRQFPECERVRALIESFSWESDEMDT